MHFDDRLATVLRTRASGLATARIQFRQLLDLLGTMPIQVQGPQIDAACDRLEELGKAISSPERAAMLREPGIRLRNPRLISLLAHGEPSVAAATLEKAQLSEDEWIDLAPALPLALRSQVRQRRDLGPRAEALFDRLGIVVRGLPKAKIPAEIAPAILNEGAITVARSAGPSGIGAIVQRIEDFRKARAPAEALERGPDAHPLYSGNNHPPATMPTLRAFDFVTDSEGCIIWSDPGMAPMAVGLRLTSLEMANTSVSRRALFVALRRRQPIRGQAFEIVGAPAISGRWRIDAAPRFDSQSGNYTGYSGRMRRPHKAEQAETMSAPESESDRMRQLLHELRTPINAVQGFAEVIQQQMFGPAPHEYRALAASIAGDAALILAGFEELDRFARLDSGGMELALGGCDLAAIIAAIVAQLQVFTRPRSSGFDVTITGEAGIEVALGQADAERMIWRLLATLAASAAPGEILIVNAKQHGNMARLCIQLPAALSALDGELLMHATAAAAPRTLSAGMFGTGFSLRLAAAEAKAAGGNLVRDGDTLEISLPGLTIAEPGHSDGRGKRLVP
jgi:two-component system OmpR family sensor kinase